MSNDKQNLPSWRSGFTLPFDMRPERCRCTPLSLATTDRDSRKPMRPPRTSSIRVGKKQRMEYAPPGRQRLKLDSQRGPGEVLVVERIERGELRHCPTSS